MLWNDLRYIIGYLLLKQLNISEYKNQQKQTINWIKILTYTEMDEIKIG